MIAFVERKHPDPERIGELLRDSEESGVWTNFGPLSLRLEAEAHRLLGLPGEREVVACSSGTAALHGLVLLEEHLAGRRLRWVVSAFTFHAQAQGPLADALVLDCDENGFLSLDELGRLRPDSYDGIVITHLFGAVAPAEIYAEFAHRMGKVLLFDAATCFGSTYAGAPFGRFGEGEIFSFHHTKPCGFGEGGAAVVPTERADVLRSLINFGLYREQPTGARSFNGKMSDVAAAYILDRWRAEPSIRSMHRDQFERLVGLALSDGLACLTAPFVAATPSLVPILFTHPVRAARLLGRRVALHKYYRPLAPRPTAEDLYGRVVCFPCHAGLAAATDRELRTIMRELASA